MSFLSRIFKRQTNEPELTAPPQPLPERNDLCWCGSGQKYKKCHLETDQEQLTKIREKELATKARRSAFR